MYLLAYYLRCRCLQVWRAVREVGLGYLLVALPLLLVFLLSILEKLRDNPHPIVPIAGAALLLGLHLRRKDAAFLQKLPLWLPLLVGAEYLLFSCPLWIALLCLGVWINALWWGGLLLLIALIPPRPSTKSYWQYKMPVHRVPLFLLEWRTGLRRQGIWLLLLYVLGLATTYWIVPPIVVVYGLAMSAASAYEPIEDKEILEVAMANSRHLLRDKILKAVLFFQTMMLPIGAGFMYWNGTYWFVWLLALLAAQLIITFAICYKYACYQPRRTHVHLSLPLAIFSLAMLVPFLLPAGLLLCWWYGRRAAWVLS